MSLTGIKSFDSLSEEERRCRHNLYRHETDRKEKLTEETYFWIQKHPEIIEIQHHLINYQFKGNITPLFNDQIDSDPEVFPLEDDSISDNFTDFSGDENSTLNSIQMEK